jgi:hypothetical protein
MLAVSGGSPPFADILGLVADLTVLPDGIASFRTDTVRPDTVRKDN